MVWNRLPSNCPGFTECRASTRETDRLQCGCIERNYALKLNLCDRLEAIADRLPERVDRFECLTIASMIVPLLRECHAFEEDTIFRIYNSTRQSAGVVARLIEEHLQDDCAGQDLTEVLLAIGHGQRIENPEALGYMLRGFFDSLRRHIAFERDHLVPAIALAPSLARCPPDAGAGSHRAR